MIVRTLISSLLTAAAVPLLLSSAAAHRDYVVTIASPRHALKNALVIVEAPRGVTSARAWALVGTDGHKIPCQTIEDGAVTRLAFIVPDMAAGATTFRLRTAPKPKPAPPAAGLTTAANDPSTPKSVGVDVKMDVDDIAIDCNGALFTKYTTHAGPNKPFFYPILTPEGNPMTRRWPVDAIKTDTHDHPHHRGLWFTHGAVNGVDFWSEGRGTGKTINTGFTDLVSGPVVGGFKAATDWRLPDGKLIATDSRDVRVAVLPNGDRLMDFTVVMKPVGGPLVFGDTKEGSFGVRVPDAWMPIKGGHMLNSNGLKNGAIWGKPANWVDYYGDTGGQVYGIAIFDDTGNLRHPTTWHARDYGLFAVNPFGLHDFDPMHAPKGAGNYTLDENKTLTFRYRLIFHKGDTQSAGIADEYASYADPPEVSIK